LYFRITDDIGWYYTLIQNTGGITGDRLSSSGGQHLLKCEIYRDHPFSNKIFESTN